jgi:hypothetical protein
MNVHTAFVPKTFVRTGVAAGLHTMSLQPFAGTLTDRDNFCVTILEFPFDLCVGTGVPRYDWVTKILGIQSIESVPRQ